MKKSIKVTIAVLAAIVIMLVIALFHYREGATAEGATAISCEFSHQYLPFLKDEGFKQIANELRYIFCQDPTLNVITAFSDLLSWRRAFDWRDVLNTFYWYGWYGNNNIPKQLNTKVLKSNTKVLKSLKNNIIIWCTHMNLLREALVADTKNFVDTSNTKLPRIIIELGYPQKGCNVYLNEANKDGQKLNTTWQNYNDDYFNTVYDINFIHSFTDVINDGKRGNNIEIIMTKLLTAEKSILNLINVMPWWKESDTNKHPSKEGLLKEPVGWNPDFTDFIMNKSTLIYFGDLDKSDRSKFKNLPQIARLDLTSFKEMKMFQGAGPSA